MYGNPYEQGECCNCCRRRTVRPKPPPVPCPTAFTALSGIQVQLQNAEGIMIENQADVLFDVVINQPGPDISYNSDTGECFLPADKSFYISWWIAVDGTETVSCPEFAVTVDDRVIAIATSPLVTCQLTGSALISGQPVPSVLSLRNVSRDRVRYAQTSVQANLVIMEVPIKQ